MKKYTVGIIGDGSLGTSLAQLFARNGHEVLLWCHKSEVAKAINSTHVNEQHLAGINLEKNVQATTNVQEIIQKSDFVIESVPTTAIKNVLKEVKKYIANRKEGQFWAAASKGIEATTYALPTQMIQEELGKDVVVVVLDAPSYGSELAQGKLSWIELAGNDTAREQKAVALLYEALKDDETVVVRKSTDPIGVQACGAFKHIVSFGIGAIDGLKGAGGNAKALALTQGIKEMSELVVVLGGRAETVLELAGIGDTSITSLEHNSRNVNSGYELTSNKRVSGPHHESGMVRGGLNALLAAHELAHEKNLSLKFFNAIYGVAYENAECDQIIQALKK